MAGSLSDLVFIGLELQGRFQDWVREWKAEADTQAAGSAFTHEAN
jgi:hypothetical protein